LASQDDVLACSEVEHEDFGTRLLVHGKKLVSDIPAVGGPPGFKGESVIVFGDALIACDIWPSDRY
jgi:hypothetical protein